ncbi:hypothetical protein HPP92_017198 [Vanilla planifolia]|uniref:PetM of cytochrome b6/f complex subunit 7 n=1 Tax=Vanilla planifolia TaxID=51239 RepID=A0A835UNT5_VANPL|nr:hypothetical protein HPP92_017776 [Vanilla planifolia]KAG0467870.1 hypothetical protein HPP92_017198 [Vanilla planifolia]
MAAIPCATFPANVVSVSARNASTKKTSVVYIQGLNSYRGLKALNEVSFLGISRSADLCFAMAVNSLKLSWKKRGTGRGGALSSTCDAAAEIFRIAAIMNGLVLIGVAVGFILLRIEASLEESE